MKLKISLLLVSLLFVSLVSAFSVTLDAPSASGTITGDSVNFSVTASDTGGDEEWNCTIYGMSTSTANSSWVTIGGGPTVANDTATTWNASLDSAVVEDATDYIFNATCTNGTDTADDTNTGIIVDNTIPQSASSLVPTTDTDGSFVFSGTITGSNTTACTLYFDGTNPGSASYTMTHSGDNCSYTASSVPEQSYVWYIQASDGTNTTDSSTQTTTVSINQGGNNYVPTEESTTVNTPVGNVPVPLIIIGIVVIFVIIAVYKKKK